jgi:hypothetical protein
MANCVRYSQRFKKLFCFQKVAVAFFAQIFSKIFIFSKANVAIMFLRNIVRDPGSSSRTFFKKSL